MTVKLCASKSCANTSDGKMNGYRMAYGMQNDDLCYEKKMVACSSRKCRWSKQLICSGNSFDQGKCLSGQSVAAV